MLLIRVLSLCLFCISCTSATLPDQDLIHGNEPLLKNRFTPPLGYTITTPAKGSFGQYLQHCKLKSIDAKVKYYNGKDKMNYGVYCSVFDMDIDKQDLQQCADAVMRLKAEYLYQEKKYSSIHFSFVSDGKPRYFQDFAKGDYSYSNFRKYMRYIFSYANTASLHDELAPKPWNEMEIGDVFVQKKNPYGHAVIVVNMASDSAGNKLFMLAQSYMPAQDIQVLVNPENDAISPWYALVAGSIETPEWTFSASDLKDFSK